MALSKYLPFLAIMLSSLPLASPQLLSSLPSCIVDCINNSPDTNCSLFDVSCLCRASAGNFLTDTVTCMRAECDNSLNTNVLLSPLQLACQLAGSPIPASAIRNAEIVASQLQGVVTTTVTAGASPSTPQSPTNVQVTTTTVQSLMTSTVTQTTTRDGNVIQSVVPVIVGQGTTRWGSGSAVSSISTSSSNSGTGGIGGAVIITTTKSAGSPYTTTSRSLASASSFQSSVSQSSSSSTGANELSTISGTHSPPTTSPTSLITPSTSATSSQDSERTSTSTSTSDNAESNSAPFRNTNAGTRSKEPRNLFTMSAAMLGLCLWL